ncbi:unnamed protein product [Cochlearia groenlandica]
MENQDSDEDKNIPVVESSDANNPIDPSSSSSPDTNLTIGRSSSSKTVATGKNLAIESSIATTKQNLSIFNDSTPPGADLSIRPPSAIGPSSPSLPTGADHRRPSCPLPSSGNDSLNPRPIVSSTYGSQVPSSSSSAIPPKPKPVHLKIDRILIGDWSKTSVHYTDLLASFFPGQTRLVWDIKDDVETESGTIKQLKRMSMQWSDVLSLSKDDMTGCLHIELKRPPRFYKKGDPNMLETWVLMDEFSQNHPSSTYRRHAIYFDPQLLKMNYENILLTAKNFWSGISQVPFPSLPHLTFSEVNVENVTEDQLLETQASQLQPNPPQQEEEEDKQQKGLKRGRDD